MILVKYNAYCYVSLFTLLYLALNAMQILYIISQVHRQAKHVLTYCSLKRLRNFFIGITRSDRATENKVAARLLLEVTMKKKR